ncbi:hypothetical protein [Sphingobacterium hungaricum]|uniref:Uncharacterized protein n=1 Tax=Sphingobacterium hungaricum TaxID=2082723 RepID=A0A928V0P7_9SPHI|nr:hypothetical protein [Sphingobacterium hungaricum]MBE8714347.1 hypothetical protein [Sphingobacterium hungaricum]
MKVKLLKKVRKEYHIHYFPKGTPVYDFGVYDIDFYHLAGKNWSSSDFDTTKNECIDRLLDILRAEYPNLGYHNRANSQLIN